MTSPVQTIDIIDPVGLTVVNSITADQSGAPLTNAGSDGSPVNTSRTWNDGVFLEVRCSPECRRRSSSSALSLTPLAMTHVQLSARLTLAPRASSSWGSLQWGTSHHQPTGRVCIGTLIHADGFASVHDPWRAAFNR